MSRVYLKEEILPFCKGCGHTLISENIDKALQTLNLPMLDVIFVTDIGCHGIIDKCINSHTVHGLHGRSIALASGIAMSLNNPNKKVIVFIGDGGATIGMQHLIDAAHRNVNLTVVLHNNMLYGMTGGQPSDFTPKGFKTPTTPEGSRESGYNICELATAAGASYVSRVIGIGNIAEQLAEALSKTGFSLIEVMEICPSYAMKSNPGMKLREVVDHAGLSLKVFADRNIPGLHIEEKTEIKQLIEPEKPIAVNYKSSLTKPVRIMITGSAGEGVQFAAETFAKAAISAGLNVTKKGSYPVTVGIGFSSSDIIISPEKILYTGSPKPDFMIITSEDGVEYSTPTLSNMKDGVVYLDAELNLPETKLEVVKQEFRKTAGAKNAALLSLLYFAHREKLFPIEALLDILKNSKVSANTDWEKLISSLG